MPRILLVLALGCGGPVSHAPEPDAAAAASTCMQIAMTGCAKACDCDPAVECVLVYGGGVLTAKHADLDACRRFAVYECESNTTSDGDKQSCLQALAAAQCTPVTHDGTPYSALSVPVVCKDDL
jgi:hypothetical protein